MDTKKLRQKILDLAIHGKLVPQDPNDEPASVLLERIRAEKERLIAEGKIKRSKKSATSDTSHYENVPEGWCITTIGEVFNLQAGKNISANDIHEFSREFPYACYGGNGIRGYVSDYNKEGRFPIIGRQGALCGNVNFAEGKFYATEHAVVVTCIAGVNVEWARYVLEAMNLNQYATATAQPGLSVATVNEVEFLLPPLKEQCRIAEFVANCFDAIESLTSQTNNLRLNLERAKSKILDLAIHGKLVLQDANDEPASELLKRINPKAVASCDNPHYEQAPFEIPDNWVWVRIDEINKFKSKSVNPQNYPIDQFELYSVPTFETGEPEFPYGKNIASSKVEVEEGDVLLCKINPHLNRVWVVRRRMSQLKSLASSEWIVIRTDEIMPEYLAITMQSPYFRELMMSNVSGVGGSLMRAQPTFVKQYMIPIPPIREQKHIIEKVSQFNQYIEAIASTLL